jgi:hypothetical protein
LSGLLSELIRWENLKLHFHWWQGIATTDLSLPVSMISQRCVSRSKGKLASAYHVENWVGALQQIKQ